MRSETSSYQQRGHQRCLDSRSFKEYSAEAGKRFTTSRSSSLSSIHARKRPSPQRGHLDSESIISKVNHKPVIEILEFRRKRNEQRDNSPLVVVATNILDDDRQRSEFRLSLHDSA